MAELTDTIKEAIVTRLARFETPQNVARDVSEEFGVTITRGQVSKYNVGTASFEGSQKWVYIFDAERAAFSTELEQHASSGIGYRIGRLQRMSEKAEAQGNMVLAAQLLAQIAKDVSGGYSNQRQHQHSGGIDHRHSGPMSAEDARVELEMRIAAIREKRPKLPASQQVIEHPPQ